MNAERPDEVLVREAVAGDREAYHVLFQRYHRRVVGLAYDILRVREDAEDVAQEAFVKAYVSLKEFKGESSFYSWLYRIVYNLSIDTKRKVTRRGGPAEQLEEGNLHEAPGFVAAVESPHASLYRRQQNEQIRKALSEISEEHRAVVMLREIDGLSYEEIASVTGLSLGTVMSRLHYARKKLQKVLAEFAPSEGTPSARSEGDQEPKGGGKRSQGMRAGKEGPASRRLVPSDAGRGAAESSSAGKSTHPIKTLHRIVNIFGVFFVSWVARYRVA